MSIDLSVNLNKIALIRNSRPGNYPNVVEHGKACLDFGAHGLTVHPRPDQRHIRPHDVYEIAQLVHLYPQAEFNIEGNPFAEPVGNYPGLLALVEQARPHQCTLVPDNNAQATSDHGFDLTVDGVRLEAMIWQLKHLGTRISLFMDPDLEQIKLAKQVGADRIELYTGPFASAFNGNQGDASFKQFVAAAELAHKLGLGVNAGHDLNLHNMQLFRTLPHLQEVSIGHALTVESMQFGLEHTIRSYLQICS